MTAWLSMIRKDFRMGRGMLLLPIIAIIIILGFSEFLKFKIGENGFLFAMAVFMLGIHPGFMVIYFVKTLRSESKRMHLWLHNPLSGFALLGSKLVSGVMTLIVSLILTTLLLFLAMNYDIKLFQTTPFTVSDTLQVVNFITINIFLSSIYFAMWYMFYWSVYITLKSRIGKGFSILGTFIVFFIINNLNGLFKESAFYSALTNWGSLHIMIPQHIVTAIGMLRNFNVNMVTDHIVVNVGVYVFYAIVSMLLFIVSSWLLDHKVEV